MLPGDPHARKNRDYRQYHEYVYCYRGSYLNFSAAPISLTIADSETSQPLNDAVCPCSSSTALASGITITGSGLIGQHAVKVLLNSISITAPVTSHVGVLLVVEELLVSQKGSCL